MGLCTKELRGREGNYACAVMISKVFSLSTVQPVSASAAHILGEVCREKQEAAIPLVRLFLHYGRIVPFISAIANAEVKRTQ